MIANCLQFIVLYVILDICWKDVNLLFLLIINPSYLRLQKRAFHRQGKNAIWNTLPNFLQIYISGTENVVADTLSRLSQISLFNDQYYENMAQAQLGDEEFKILKEGNTSLVFKEFKISNDRSSLFCETFTGSIDLMFQRNLEWIFLKGFTVFHFLVLKQLLN